MTVKMLQNMFNTTTEDKAELLKLADELKKNATIELSQYASLKASINTLNKPAAKPVTGRRAYRYSKGEITLASSMLIKAANYELTEIEALSCMSSVLPSDCGFIRNFAHYVLGMRKQLKGQRGSHLATPASWANEILSQLSGVQQMNYLYSIKLQIEYDKKYGTKSRVLKEVVSYYEQQSA